jgi:hypothetical protein
MDKKFKDFIDNSKIFWLFMSALPFLIMGYSYLNDSLWLDEIHVLKLIQYDYHVMYHLLINGDTQLPLYYTLLKFFYSITGESEFSLKIFSLICAILGTFFSTQILIKYFSAYSRWIFILLLTISPFFQYYALEVRPYSFLYLLLSINYYYFLCTPQRKYHFIFSIICLIYSSYIGAVISTVQLAMLILRKKLSPYYLIFITIICVPLLKFVYYQKDRKDFLSWAKDLPYDVPLGDYSSLVSTNYWILLFFFTVHIILFLIKKEEFKFDKKVLKMLGVIFLSQVILFIFNAFTNRLLFPKYFISVVLIAFLYLSDALSQTYVRRKSLFTLFIVVLVSGVINFKSNYSSNFKNWRSNWKDLQQSTILKTFNYNHNIYYLPSWLFVHYEYSLGSKKGLVELKSLQDIFKNIEDRQITEFIYIKSNVYDRQFNIKYFEKYHIVKEENIDQFTVFHFRL